MVIKACILGISQNPAATTFRQAQGNLPSFTVSPSLAGTNDTLWRTEARVKDLFRVIALTLERPQISTGSCMVQVLFHFCSMDVGSTL